MSEPEKEGSAEPAAAEPEPEAQPEESPEDAPADAVEPDVDESSLPTSFNVLPPVANPLIPRLQDLCMDCITKNFAECPQLYLLAPKYRQKVIQDLPLNLPLSLATMAIPDGLYWKRRLLSEFGDIPHDPTRRTWKRFYLENYASRTLENATPENINDIFNDLAVISPYVREVRLTRAPSKVSMLRLFKTFRNLIKLSLVYGEPRRNFAHYEEFDTFDIKAANSATLADCQAMCQDFIALGPNCSLQEFDMADNSLDDASFLRIAKGLYTGLNRLTSLTFSHNQIGDEGAKAIASCLLKSPIKKLDLSDNKIGPEGCERICACALKCPTFEELNLASNKIGDVGCYAIADLLEKCVTLKVLNIAGNRIERMENLAKAFEGNRTIRVLILAANPIADADLAELARIGNAKREEEEGANALDQLDLRTYELTPEDFDVSTTETSEAPLLRFK